MARLSRADLLVAAASLRALLEQIDAGKVEATPQERAHLAGAVETLAAVSPEASRRPSDPGHRTHA